MYEKFAELLVQKGVSAYAVSKATGIPRSTFSDWKMGRCTPKTLKLKKIADYFGKNIEYFLDAS